MVLTIQETVKYIEVGVFFSWYFLFGFLLYFYFLYKVFLADEDDGENIIYNYALGFVSLLLMYLGTFNSDSVIKVLNETSAVVVNVRYYSPFLFKLFVLLSIIYLILSLVAFFKYLSSKMEEFKEDKWKKF